MERLSEEQASRERPPQVETVQVSPRQPSACPARAWPWFHGKEGRVWRRICLPGICEARSGLRYTRRFRPRSAAQAQPSLQSTPNAYRSAGARVILGRNPGRGQSCVATRYSPSPTLAPWAGRSDPGRFGDSNRPRSRSRQIPFVDWNPYGIYTSECRVHYYACRLDVVHRCLCTSPGTNANSGQGQIYGRSGPAARFAGQHNPSARFVDDGLGDGEAKA